MEDHWVVESNQAKQQREKGKSEKHTHSRGPKWRREREKGAGRLSEQMIADNYPKLGKETEIQV